MSSTTCCGNARMHSAISLSERRKVAGDHLSNFSEYSRTAASPRAAISARIASTVLRTCALFSAFASADWPILMWRIMACSPNLVRPVYDDLHRMHARRYCGRLEFCLVLERAKRCPPQKRAAHTKHTTYD